MQATDLLCFTGPRKYLFGPTGFVTAMDCASGPWGFAQQYWGQDKNGKFYPNENGTVMTQVVFIKQDGFWCVAAEKQFALDGKNLYPKYVLEYSGCKFCPVEFSGHAVCNSSGASLWTELDPKGNIVHGPTPVPWAYSVYLSDSGELQEYYTQNGGLAYWKTTQMAAGRGDTLLNDLVSGTVSRQEGS